jgi:hypothetical protein
MPAPTPIPFDALESALQWSSGGESLENEALLSRSTGQVFFTSEHGDADDDLPDDIDDEALYLAVPHKNDLGLGRNLVLAFAEEHAPMHVQTIESFFRHKGAYAKFKALLERTQLMDRWYVFEATATRRALEAWAADNGFVVVDDLSTPRTSDTP